MDHPGYVTHDIFIGTSIAFVKRCRAKRNCMQTLDQELMRLLKVRTEWQSRRCLPVGCWGEEDAVSLGCVLGQRLGLRAHHHATARCLNLHRRPYPTTAAPQVIVRPGQSKVYNNSACATITTYGLRGGTVPRGVCTFADDDDLRATMRAGCYVPGW